MKLSQKALCGSRDGVITLWNLAGVEQFQALDGGSPVNALAVSDDGRRLASTSQDGAVSVWDLETGEKQWSATPDEGPAHSVVFGPADQRLLAGSVKALTLWDLQAGEVLKTIEGHMWWVLALAMDISGRLAVSGSRDRTMKVWDLDSETELHSFAMQWPVNAVAITPAADRVLCGAGDNSITVWDLATATLTGTLTGHRAPVNSVAITPDGRRALSGSNDGTLRLWDLDRLIDDRVLGTHDEPVNSVAISADGRLALSGSDDRTMKVWDLERAEEVARVRVASGVNACAFATSAPS